MNKNALLEATSRVALAAYLHDLGKFAERAGAFDGDPRLDAHLQLYCPYHDRGRDRGKGWFSHRHAAYTALAFDLLEHRFPDLLGGDTTPFSGRQYAGGGAVGDATDSLVNAAAAHHKPVTFLQWIVATADRIASGFEREEFDRYNHSEEGTETGRNHYQARQLTLFEQLKKPRVTPGELRFRYPLTPFAPKTIFPEHREACEPSRDDVAKAEYARLWHAFTQALFDDASGIPRAHRGQLALWLDHFDSLWLTYTHAIPSATAFGVRPDVSLYDHSRTTAALAAALWRWHEAMGQTDEAAAERLRQRSDFREPKFLLVQGDFFGIQDYIFSTGGETRKHAAKLLRGRSFQVSLFAELAALRILDALSLPPTSQVINAAGKFLLVAPNTPHVVSELERIRKELDDWFLKRTFGQAGLGLVWTEACCEDFLRKSRDSGMGFAELTRRAWSALERAKYQRFGLCDTGGRILEADFSLGVCKYHGHLPADRPDGSCAISRDQIELGQGLVRFDRVLIVDSAAADLLHSSENLLRLEVDIFGYTVALTRSEAITGRFGELASSGALRRCWDFSLPQADDETGLKPLWNGYARRFISAYVPRFQEGEHDPRDSGKYQGVTPEDFEGEIKTFTVLACEDRALDADDDKWLGVSALGVLKGDIDDLGTLFLKGLGQPSFAKWASLSRQVNAFFAFYLPWLLVREFQNVYTVFAGGDDFFLIGPWRTVQRLASRMREEFTRYVAENPDVHFSAGIATQKAGTPLHMLAQRGAEALRSAKAFTRGEAGEKNAVTVFGETVAWERWAELERRQQRLDQLRQMYHLTTGYIYGLLEFIEARRQETAGKAEAAMWRSRLQYRTRRFVEDRLRGRDEEGRRQAFEEILHDVGSCGIEALGAPYRIVLFNHLYQYRDR